MTNSTTFNEIRQPPLSITGRLFDEPVAPKTESESFEWWIAALAKLAEEQEQEARVAREPSAGNCSRETRPPLQKLAAGPWRSLGGYFDYSLWPDRERFLELDKAIATSQDLREAEIQNDMDMI